MEFLDLAKKRYSVRSYLPKAVEQEKLDQILEAGRVAPTGANRQPQRVLVVQSKEGLEKVSKAANIYGAPLALIVCGKPSLAWVRGYDQKNIMEIDATIVTDHMMLEAADLGLGSVWICHFNPAVLRQEFSIPEDLTPVNLLAVGYAAEEPASAGRHKELRKPLRDTVSFETL